MSSETASVRVELSTWLKMLSSSGEWIVVHCSGIDATFGLVTCVVDGFCQRATQHIRMRNGALCGGLRSRRVVGPKGGDGIGGGGEEQNVVERYSPNNDMRRMTLLLKRRTNKRDTQKILSPAGFWAKELNSTN